MMKTSELTGHALDWAVANCEGLLAFGYRTDRERFVIEDSDSNSEGFMPSTDWAQGGSIIEREQISIEHKTREGVWVATRIEGSAVSETHGDTPLIAAMRSYVASKLGDEVDVPNELKGKK